jgi:hypothetical protein
MAIEAGKVAGVVGLPRQHPVLPQPFQRRGRHRVPRLRTLPLDPHLPDPRSVDMVLKTLPDGTVPAVRPAVDAVEEAPVAEVAVEVIGEVVGEGAASDLFSNRRSYSAYSE